MLNAAMATASSIQFWNGTRPTTRNSSTSQSSKEAPGLQFIGNSLFDGHLGCDHNAGDFAASRASDRLRYRECWSGKFLPKSTTPPKRNMIAWRRWFSH